MKIFGKNAVKEALNSPQTIKKIYLSNQFKDQDIMQIIKEKKVPYEGIEQKAIDKLYPKNQGIMASIDEFEYTNLSDILKDEVIIMLDHLEDPHNFGAIIRTAEAAGIKSIVIPKDRSVDVNATVMKTSAGALNHMQIVRVVNLSRAIETLKEHGYFIYGAESNGTDYKKVSYANKSVLVIGSEGNGLSRIVSNACDEIVSLPMKGKVNSLNASVASAILIYDLISRSNHNG